MNYAWARKRVSEYLQLLDNHRSAFKEESSPQVRELRRALADEINLKLSTIIRIAQRVEPRIVTNFFFEEGGGYWPYTTRRNVTAILLGAVEDAEAVEENLGPVGPRLSAVELHPWVRDAARDLWDGGHRREALQAAATQLELQMRAKLGRSDGAGKDLSVAFSPKAPEPGQPRLRLSGFEPGTDDFKSAHQGAMHFGQGCFLAIRNVTTHQAEQPPEDRALEMLAALSLLARWVDEATLETAAT